MLFFYQLKASIGMVLCDKEGQLCFAASIGMQELNDPKVIQLMAILRGLQLRTTKGIENLIGARMQ